MTTQEIIEVLTRLRLSRLFVTVQVLDLRKLRTLLMALLRFLRKVLLRKRLTRSRRSLRLKALRLLLSNFDLNIKCPVWQMPSRIFYLRNDTKKSFLFFCNFFQKVC